MRKTCLGGCGRHAIDGSNYCASPRCGPHAVAGARVVKRKKGSKKTAK